MVVRLAQWIVDRTAPKDPARRERYFRAWGDVGLLLLGGYVVRLLGRWAGWW